MTVNTLNEPLTPDNDDTDRRRRLYDDFVGGASQMHTMIRYTQIAWQQGDQDDKAMIDQALDVLLRLSSNLENAAYEIV